MPGRYRFDAVRHAPHLAALFAELPRDLGLDERRFERLLRRHSRPGGGLYSRSELLAGFGHLAGVGHPAVAGLDRTRLAERLAGKPVRTRSGVAPVSVLTRPFPCPGRCVFCPNDVAMPKSYLTEEPGCQRAAENGFDPYRQVRSRLAALAANGHRVAKVELIVQGGTWSHYPEAYRRWFLERCLAAMNEFGAPDDKFEVRPVGPGEEPAPGPRVAGRRLGIQAGRSAGPSEAPYNRRLLPHLRRRFGAALAASEEAASWADLALAQQTNEGARARCVGLSVETRPDRVTEAEVAALRRLGCTKVQLGVQSLSDAVLAACRRGHGVAATRRAFSLLRAAGFKIQAHWMANLPGSDPEADVADFARLFADPDFRPDELKVYPCSLVESAELMRIWEEGGWRPYPESDLLDVVVRCLAQVPPWCRVSRVVRDIPGTAIIAGSRITNLRQAAETELARRGLACRDVRAREVGAGEADPATLTLEEIAYETATGEERFLQFIDGDGRLAGFLRLSLPGSPAFLPELSGRALLREVHVYGAAAGYGERGPAQHRGLGTRLVRRAAEIAHAAGYPALAVISAVGTRRWYRRLGFTDGPLYQHLAV